MMMEQRNGGPPVDYHRMPLVTHHTDVWLIAGGPLATWFAGLQMPPSDCRLRVAGGPSVAF